MRLAGTVILAFCIMVGALVGLIAIAAVVEALAQGFGS